MDIQDVCFGTPESNHIPEENGKLVPPAKQV